MSNYEFLVAKSEQIVLYPWFELLYKEVRTVEQDYVEGNINRMLRDSRTALEFAVKKYMLEMNITVKKQDILTRNKHKKAERQGNSKPINLTSAEDVKLLEGSNAVQPAGHLLPAAHFIQKADNGATHNIEHTENRRAYDCLKNLHDVILWIYNQLTGEGAVSEFSLDHIDSKLQYTERERLQEAFKDTAVNKVSQRKKKKKHKKKDAFHIETHKNQIVIVNQQEQEIFVFEDSEKEEKYQGKQLPTVIDSMKYMLAEIKSQKANVEEQIREYEQENQIALVEIQKYIHEFDLEEGNAQALLEYFASIQKEQHEGLQEFIHRMEEKLRDKEACIQFLEQLSEEQKCRIDMLHLRIINLEKNIQEMLDEIRGFQTQEKTQLLSQWMQRVKGSFQSENVSQDQERTYTREEFEQLYRNFKQQYARVSFLYESEKLIRQKQEYELAEYQFKLDEQRNVNRKLADHVNAQKLLIGKNKKNHKFFMRLMRYFSLFFILVIIALIILFLWQREQVNTYQTQYDEVMSMLE